MFALCRPKHQWTATSKGNTLEIWAQWPTPVDLSVGDIRSQTAVEWLQVAQRSQWRAYRKPPSLLRMLPLLTPCAVVELRGGPEGPGRHERAGGPSKHVIWEKGTLKGPHEITAEFNTWLQAATYHSISTDVDAPSTWINWSTMLISPRVGSGAVE